MNEDVKNVRELMLAIDRDEDGNPTSLEGAIRSAILKCPDMVQWRDDALDLIYCTLGSGIDWNDHGRLGDTHPNNYLNVPPDCGFGPWSRDFGRDDSLSRLVSGLPTEMADRLRNEIEQEELAELNAAREVVADIDTRCKTYRTKRRRWYPASWYASHLCPPENAQRDFIEGAIECTTLIICWEPPLDDPSFFRSRHMKNFAASILPALKERLALVATS